MRGVLTGHPTSSVQTLRVVDVDNRAEVREFLISRGRRDAGQHVTQLQQAKRATRIVSSQNPSNADLRTLHSAAGR